MLIEGTICFSTGWGKVGKKYMELFLFKVNLFQERNDEVLEEKSREFEEKSKELALSRLKLALSRLKLANY